MTNHILYLIIAAMFLSIPDIQAQGWKDKLKKGLNEVVPESSSVLSQDEAGMGIKEALIQGINKGVDQLSQPDGYFKDELIKILMPEEAKKAEEYLRKFGQGKKVDEAIEAMNRAAENAASGAKDIFVVAIKQMTFEDALNIVSGDNDAATEYLIKTTRTELTEKFKPIIKTSLDKVDATKYWNTVFSSYNKVPFVKPVNPNLEDHATEKALDGLFKQVSKQEKEIRENPGARTTELLKKVFAN